LTGFVAVNYHITGIINITRAIGYGDPHTCADAYPDKKMLAAVKDNKIKELYQQKIEHKNALAKLAVHHFPLIAILLFANSEKPLADLRNILNIREDHVRNIYKCLLGELAFDNVNKAFLLGTLLGNENTRKLVEDQFDLRFARQYSRQAINRDILRQAVNHLLRAIELKHPHAFNVLQKYKDKYIEQTLDVNKREEVTAILNKVVANAAPLLNQISLPAEDDRDSWFYLGLYYLGLNYQSEFFGDSAIECFSRAAKLGHLAAQNQLKAQGIIIEIAAQKPEIMADQLEVAPVDVEIPPILPISTPMPAAEQPTAPPAESPPSRRLIFMNFDRSLKDRIKNGVGPQVDFDEECDDNTNAVTSICKLQ
jgi:hypothetical protein